MYRLELDPSMCISCGTCIDICPELFEFGDDEISTIKGAEILDDKQVLEMEDPSCSLDAVENCPVTCIHLYKDGEELG